jgi:hypothetical protein
MAFVRAYSEQGDPSHVSMRAGRLVSRRRMARTGALEFRPRAGRKSRRVSHRMNAEMGDPFSFRMPKFVRKLSLKKIVRGAGKLAAAALPIALPFIGGPLGSIAGALVGGRGGSGGPESPAPELTYQPPQVGTVGEATRGGYEVPGIEVSAPYYDDEGDEDDYSDVDDSGESDLDYYDDEEE